MIRGVIIFIVLTNLYLYLKLRSGFGGGRWNLFYLLWAVAWGVLPFITRSGRVTSGRWGEVLFSLGFTWVAIVGMACMIFLFTDLLSLLSRLVDALAGTTFTARFFIPARRVPGTLILVILVVGYSFFEAWNVRPVYVTLTTSKPLPSKPAPSGEKKSLRLVHLTDIHLGGLHGSGRLKRLMEIVRAAQPDLLVITGDLVDGDMAGRDADAAELASNGARYGAFIVPGNHDYYSGIDRALAFMKKAKLTVLRGQSVMAGDITLMGLDDPARSGIGITQGERLPEGLVFPKGPFVLLLKHRPQVLPETIGLFDLQLSGHTHGGQIWPFGYLAARLNKSVQHLSFHSAPPDAEGRSERKSAVYVSNGVGFWGPPLRFLTPPEVTIIDLVSEPEGN
ncbi:MAG: metallophosphoesterase [Synergistaceae bacterium]|nr:metallophosphoesterase [Synergistaceae bacterium]